ncbi:MAG: PAS domain-containing sensor histidine kinase [Desulfotignum sp.]|nr:PAS domain-containing sensor histidine kinase [Desulfotignum sp.]
MDTYFASPQRTDDAQLALEIEEVSKSPVVSGILKSISGFIAILDEHRQIIALNDSFLKMLGIHDPKEALGLRPGEALQCVHANGEPAGCGTTKYCSTCGAAVAIVSSLGQDIPCERLCALSTSRGGQPVDLALLVKSQPIKIESRKFILLFLQDITTQEQRAALERTFYHDINNMLTMLLLASELLIEDQPSQLAATIHQAAYRLSKEVAIQRSLSDGSVSSYQAMWDDFSIEVIFEELRSFFNNHPAAREKKIEYQNVHPNLFVKTDICLLLRVLCNMIINALEATEKNGVVKVWSEHKNQMLDFCVWNSQAIPPETSQRIFQRNFSTKSQAGRGIGTYSMKLFGEKILGGKVRFSSSKEDGTIFKFSVPLL